MKFLKILLLIPVLFVALTVSAHEGDGPEEWDEDFGFRPFSCKKATAKQISVVNQGNKLVSEFLGRCARETNSSPWCLEVIRPNPASIDVFRCTYGPVQVHQLIHPNRNTWKNAIQAIQMIDALEKQNIRTCLIYNWWRPEPYNANVGGAAGRHPQGTSVDVRFCSMEDMEKAFTQLCQWRKQGRLRALGYYGTTALHFGVRDSKANTWGKSCS